MDHLFLVFMCSALILQVFCQISCVSSRRMNIQVGVILDLNSSDSTVGQVGWLGLSLAYYDFYRDHTDFKTRLLLTVRDSNGTVVDAAAAALDLMQNVKADAIIGPQNSAQAGFVMDLGEMAHVPIISFSATSPSLIPRTPYFVRTAQSDANQVGSIASVIKAFNWTKVVVIYEETELGIGVMPYLSNALQDVNAQITHRIIFPRTASDDHISQELGYLMRNHNRVFVVHLSQFLGKRLFLKAKELGMMSKGYAWIVTNGLMDLFSTYENDVVEAMQGVLGVKPLIPKSDKLLASADRWTEMLNEDIIDGVNLSEISFFLLWAYDTFVALAKAAEAVVLNSEKGDIEVDVGSKDTFVLKESKSGPKLLEALLETKFEGVAGNFHLVNGQLEPTPYHIVNIVGRHKIVVAKWTPSQGISKHGFKAIIWPGNTTLTPRGWEIPINFTLKIGVAQKPGFNEFLKVEIDPQTNLVNVSGYFKDLFDSVMGALPYKIPYEYMPYPFFDHNGSRVGSYDDLCYRVSLQDEYDGAIGDITITDKRSSYADFTLPFAEGGVACLVPIKYEDGNDEFTFLKPLTIELWVTIAAFYFFTSFIIWILARRMENPPGQHAGLIAYFPFFPGDGMEAYLLFLLLVTWALVGSLINSTYTASLSSHLTVLKLQPTVTDVTQLIKKGEYVGCQEGSFVVSFLKNLGFDERKIKTYNSTEHCHEALMLGSKNGGISAYYDVIPHIKVLLSQYCGKYMIFGETYRTEGFAFVFPKGFPAVADISRAIIQLTEKGVILDIDQFLASNQTCSSPRRTSSKTSVTLRSFLVLFIITGCVTVSCLLISLYRLLSENQVFRQRMLEIKEDVISKIQELAKLFKKVFKELVRFWFWLVET